VLFNCPMMNNHLDEIGENRFHLRSFVVVVLINDNNDEEEQQQQQVKSYGHT
jgi:hypothetical protein